MLGIIAHRGINWQGKIDVKYEDGREKSFTSEIIADKDGKVYEGCVIGLTREVVIALLRGTPPIIYPILGEESQDLVRYIGYGKWGWKSEKEILNNTKYSTDYLYSLYLERKTKEEIN